MTKNERIRKNEKRMRKLIKPYIFAVARIGDWSAERILSFAYYRMSRRIKPLYGMSMGETLALFINTVRPERERELFGDHDDCMNADIVKEKIEFITPTREDSPCHPKTV